MAFSNVRFLFAYVQFSEETHIEEAGIRAYQAFFSLKTPFLLFFYKSFIYYQNGWQATYQCRNEQ